MNNLTFTLALFLGVIQPVHFSTGLNGDESLSDEVERQKKDHPLGDSTYAQIETDLQSESLSSIYAKWIELPDCQKFTNADGSWDKTKGEIVQLAEDLTNASIATCKGPTMPWPVPPASYYWNTTLYGAQYREPVPKSVIYDPVWKTSQPMQSWEHQVATQNMPSNVGKGPKGDFWPNWKYRDGQAQPYQKAGDSWNEAGPAGKNYSSYDWTQGYSAGDGTYYKNYSLPTNYQPGAPDANLIQLDVPKGWVELPDCPGTVTPAKPLADDVSNASWATCKPAVRPAKVAAATVPAAALAQKNNNINWVELPKCSDEGANQTTPLRQDLENASSATCQKKDKSYVKSIAAQTMEAKDAAKALIEDLNNAKK